MSQPKLSDVLSDIHVELAKDLLKRVKSGTATAADLSVARAFLRDNGIQGAIERHAPLKALSEALPFAANDD